MPISPPELITITLDKEQIITACVAILLIFFAYFKWKFRTYGIIDARLKKLDKLETIESTLELAKFDTQMQRLNEILKLERIKAIGKGGVEFEYQKRAKDSERLLEFSLNVSKITERSISRYNNVTKKGIDLHSVFSDGKENIEYQSIMEHFGMDEMLKDVLSIEHTKMQFSLFFNNYACDRFDDSYKEWQKNALYLGQFDLSFIGKMQDALSSKRNKVEAEAIYTNVMNERNNIEDDSQQKLFLSFQRFVDSLNDLTTLIREEGKIQE